MKARPTILIIFLVPLAVLAFLMINLAVFHKNEIPSDTSKDLPKVRATVMETVVAEPGKIVRVKVGGKEVGSYTCSPADAAVAVIYLDGDIKKYNVLGRRDYAAEPKTHPATFNTVNSGNACFLILKKGYSRPLDHVVETVHFLGDANNIQSVPLATINVPFNSLPKPIRVMAPPSAVEASKAEHYATATFEPGSGFIDLKQGDYNDNTVGLIGNAFCPPIKYKPQELPIMSADDGTDCVMVHLIERRRVVSDYTLTYKNAEIIEVGNYRTLWLPTTQSVGEISGVTATVNSLDKSRLLASGIKKSVGGMYINIGKDPYGRLGAATVGRQGRFGMDSSSSGNPDILAIVDVSPRPEAMGLTELDIASNINGASVKLGGNPKSTTQVMKLIPELKVHLRYSHPGVISERDLILPVHKKEAEKKRLSSSVLPGVRNLKRF